MMSNNIGETTELDDGADVAMSEDSGVSGINNSVASSNISIDQHSESGDSAITLVEYEQSPLVGHQYSSVAGHEHSLVNPANTHTFSDSAYSTMATGTINKPEGTQRHTSNLTENNLPKEREDASSRTETWAQQVFEIFVRNLDGKSHTIEVDQYEDVSKFREKVCSKLGIPNEQQRLTSQEGKTLQDGKSLCDYNIKKHSTVYCQGRLRGG
uniref:Ubiquitin-like domain-containing protein n=1 Tax=Arion vulgaris TaxID=1028688 RepID=A0A0B7BTR7_9EUPU